MKKIVSLSKSFLYLLIFTLCFSFASANLSYAAANDDASKTAATNADKTAKNKEVAGTCTKEAMDSMYNAKDAQNCWYCRIVTLMTDAFLQAAWVISANQMSGKGGGKFNSNHAEFRQGHSQMGLFNLAGNFSFAAA